MMFCMTESQQAEGEKLNTGPGLQFYKTNAASKTIVLHI